MPETPPGLPLYAWPWKPAPPPPEETPQESLIGRIHDNWLEPASAPSQFKCLIRIDYLAGGRIAAVHFVKPCGSYELEESVRRAVWKSQPIPLIEARTAAGTIDIEFTPKAKRISSVWRLYFNDFCSEMSICRVISFAQEDKRNVTHPSS